jgi:hypothetical protein
MAPTLTRRQALAAGALGAAALAGGAGLVQAGVLFLAGVLGGGDAPRG